MVSRVDRKNSPGGARKRRPCPADFTNFWFETLDDLLAQSAHARSVSLPAVDTPGAIAAEFRSLGDVPVRCWFSGARPPAESSPSPLVVTSHGYGGAVDPERIRRLGSLGMNVVGFDARGFGLSRDALPFVSSYGYLLTGADTKESCILRGAVADFVQAYRSAVDWFGVPSHVTFQGFSFAGGLAVMAAALLQMGSKGPPPPSILAVGAPTFGDVDERIRTCESGSGRELADYLKLHPEKAIETLSTFDYFDTRFFAPHLPSSEKMRILAGIGAFDPVVPAPTVRAIYDALKEEPELFEFPCSHTDLPEEAQWVRWESAWIQAAKSPKRTHSPEDS